MGTSSSSHVRLIAFFWKSASSTMKQDIRKSSLSFWRCHRSSCSHVTKSSSIIRLVRTQIKLILFLQSSNTNNENNGHFETFVPNVTFIAMAPLCPYLSIISFCHGLCIPRMKGKFMMSCFLCHMKTSFGCSQAHIFTLSKSLWYRRHTLIFNLLS